jgi:hypothetical protein
MTRTTPQTGLEDLIPDSDEVIRGAAALPAALESYRDWASTWLAAWNARDVDAIVEHVTDDIVYDDPGMWGELVVGRAHFKANIEMVFRAFPDLLFIATEWPVFYALDGKCIAVPSRAITTFTGDLRGGPSRLTLAGTGRPLDVFCLDLYEFRDAKLCKWTALNKEFEMARQAGLAPNGSALRVLIAVQRFAARFQRRANHVKTH